MNFYNQMSYNQSILNNNVWMAIALSKSNSDQHHPPSKDGAYVCGGVMLIMLLALIITFIILIRKS